MSTTNNNNSSSSPSPSPSPSCPGSVSMCVLRFEVAKDLPLPNHLNYTASKLIASNAKMSEEMSTSGSTSTHRAVRASNNSSSSSGSGAKDRAKMSARQEHCPTGGAADDGWSPHGSDLSVLDEEQPFQLVVNKHRGKRKIHDIVIETHSVEQTEKDTVATTTMSPTKMSSSSSPSPSLSIAPASVDKTSWVNFFSGNPFVEVTKGILHLFKENQMTSLTGDVSRSEMLCILSVPASMTSHELLQFMAPCSPNVGHIRIIRDATPNQYMALIKFRSQTDADEFYVTFNAKRFNSIEPHVCHLVYVASVETTKEFEDGCLPLEGHTELPTCPVCLERMDESVDGILTILCNHSFHGGCLAKWGDTSCPVCRYCQTPEAAAADNRCAECLDCRDSLWICLICGHVGCGRYVEGHAYKHFVETQHTYAMQLGDNNRVWDYAGDNYVHRLIQNKADGKLVELNDESHPASVEQDEKLDSMQLEYTYLLTSQLESQRLYFEEKVVRIELEARRQVDELVERMKRMSDECGDMKRRMDTSGRDKTKIQQLTSKLQKLQLELAEEREMNACLQENQQEWQARVRLLEGELERTKLQTDAETAELKEQLRDVMFYLEAEQTLRSTADVTAEEIAGGSIVVGPPAATTVGAGAAATASSSSSHGQQTKGSGNHRRKKKS